MTLRFLCPRTLRSAHHLSGRATLGGVAHLGRRKPARSVSRCSRRRSLQVNALDAAMPFDFESRAAAKMKAERSLKIGIVGFGSFGQFLARRIAQQGHKVLAVSRTDYSAEAKEMGVQFFQCSDDFAEQHPDVVILATSILSTRTVLQKLPLLRFRRSTLFVDVLSVKVFPKQVMLELLPDTMDILCTHPMFGPDSGKGSWTGLNLQYEMVRTAPDEARARRVENFLEIFRSEGCNMVEMTCEEHDQQAANTQFITHTVGRILGAMQLSSTPINTKGYESLLNLVENTANDTFDLYYGLFMYNQNSMETLEALEHAFDDVKRQLFTELHKVVRNQVFPSGESKQQLQLPIARPDSVAAPTSAVPTAAKLNGSQNKVESAQGEG